MKTKEDIYAQWCAEQFAEWIAENKYNRFELPQTVGTDKVEYRWTDSEYQGEYTTKQLYDKFSSTPNIK